MIRRPVKDLLTTWESLTALSRHFGTTEPKLIFGRTRRGWYRWANRSRPASISLPSAAYGGGSIEATLVHEFAHHLQHTRHGYTCHDNLFRQVLTEVAAEWYGNPAEYPWHLEYASIRAAGPSDHPKLVINTEALLAELR